MVDIKKISHVCYDTPDLAQQTEYYTNVLGLKLIDKGSREIYLSSTTEHHSVVLRQGPTNCTTLGFQIGKDDDLDAFEHQVKAHGIKTERKRDAQPTIADQLTFEDIKGTVIEVFRAPEPLQHGFQAKGVVPNKLGHVAFHVTDVQAATKFYVDVLGFRTSDWIGDFFSFLRCSSDHHTINLIGTGTNRHFHTAFELRDWGHVQSACDLLGREGYQLLWGPGRHGPGHNLFTYHKGPNGLITELFAELDVMPDEALGYFEPRTWHRDHPQRPKIWPKGPDTANFWGPGPSDEMNK